MSKKILAITLAVGMLAFAITQSAQALTAEEVQARINELLKQIEELQKQLTQLTPAVTYNFTRDLTIGSRGDDVRALQTLLKKQDLDIYPEGLVTGYFGKLTRAALARYQAKVGISPAVGYFGPKTRAHINALMTTATPTPTPTETPTTSPTPTSTPTPTRTLPFLSVDLKIATDKTNWQDFPPLVRDAPLNGVDAKATVSGTATGDIIYKFDCTNDGTWELTTTQSGETYTAVDLCNYPSAGTYTAKVQVTRQGLVAEDTADIAVVATPTQIITKIITKTEKDSETGILMESIVKSEIDMIREKIKKSGESIEYQIKKEEGKYGNAYFFLVEENKNWKNSETVKSFDEIAEKYSEIVKEQVPPFYLAISLPWEIYDIAELPGESCYLGGILVLSYGPIANIGTSGDHMGVGEFAHEYAHYLQDDLGLFFNYHYPSFLTEGMANALAVYKGYREWVNWNCASTKPHELGNCIFYHLQNKGYFSDNFFYRLHHPDKEYFSKKCENLGDKECLKGFSALLAYAANENMNHFIENNLLLDIPFLYPEIPQEKWNYCSPEHKCQEREGDCDTDSDCAEEFRCRHNVGEMYKTAPSMDFCEKFIEVFEEPVNVEAGTTDSIRWAATPGIAVTIDLYKGDNFYKNILSNFYIQNIVNSYSWWVPLPPDIEVGDRYKLKIYESSQPEIGDESNYFSIIFSTPHYPTPPPIIPPTPIIK